MAIESGTHTDRMNILMTINDSYTEAAIVLLQSLFAHSESDICIYLLVSDLHIENRKRLKHLAKKNKSNIVFIRVDKGLFAEAPSREKVSIETYYRLLAFALLPDVEKVLYLDADMLVTGSLKKLWETDLAGDCIAGVADMGEAAHDVLHRAAIGMKYRNSIYVNGGVLLMDLKAMRENLHVEQIFNIIRKKRNVLVYQDQDIINLVFEGKIHILQQIYNYAPLYRNTGEFLSYNLGLQRGSKPVIIHYFGAMKPWVFGYGHKYLWRYWKYCRYGDCQSLRLAVAANLLIRPISVIAQGCKGWIWDLRNKHAALSREDLYRFWIRNAGTYGSWLERNGYLRIAIYGVGMWGKAVLNELSRSHVTINYAIDRYADQEQIQGISIIRPDEACEAVQIILLCVENDFSGILDELQCKNIAPVLTLENFVLKLLPYGANDADIAV